MSDEIDSLINDLTGESSGQNNLENVSNTFKEKYQIPVKVGKAGNPIDEGDDLWIVGTFLPNQYVNELHLKGHNGIDLKAPLGTPIYPIASGIVTETQQYPKGGITCKISHENGKVTSYYAHMSQLKVSIGQKITPQTIIGLVGDTGNAKGRGAHLHYEVKINGSHVDPFSINNKLVGSLTSQARLNHLQNITIKKSNILSTLIDQYLGHKKTAQDNGLTLSERFDSGQELATYLKVVKNS
jgi:murein DD-endopeptidase MepM/ murein hydrolase activator NlpD